MAVIMTVVFHNGTDDKYVVNAERPWRIDVMHRMLVIGRSVPRVMIPLDNIRHIILEEVPHADIPPCGVVRTLCRRT